VLAVNGEDVSLDEKSLQADQRQTGPRVRVPRQHNGEKSGARSVKYKALTGDEWTQPHYENAVEHARDYVERKSGGKVELPAHREHGPQNQAQFEREAYEYIVAKTR